MNNSFINKFKSSVKLNVKGRNINRFINRVVHSKILILSMDKLSNLEINIVILKKDLPIFKKLLSIYDCEVVDSYGFMKFKSLLSKNSVFLFFLFIGFCTLIFLSNVIFDVEVIYDKQDIQSLILSELKKYGIMKYHFVKKYDEIAKIKSNILNDYKEKLEWLEIERVGVKYIVRLEERKIPDVIPNTEVRNVIAKKSAVIRNIYASNGVIVHHVNDYVKKGDVLISGDILLNDEVKNQVSAEGSVFGEVWYKSSISFPLVYNEINYGSKIKSSLEFNFLSKKIDLFGYNDSNSVVVNSSKLVYNFVVPFNISLVKRREAEIVNKIYTIDEALDAAEEKSILALKNRLESQEYIISYKRLRFDVDSDNIVLEMFFSVYENITDYGIIEVQE